MGVFSVAPVYDNVRYNDDSCLYGQVYIKQFIEYIGWMSVVVVCTVGSQKWIGNYRFVWLGTGWETTDLLLA